MNNQERFRNAIDWKPIDRIQTFDFIDHRQILAEYSGYEETRHYSFEEWTEITAKAWSRIGLDVTRFAADPSDQWVGAKIAKWTRFFGINPDRWQVGRSDGISWISERPFISLSELEKHMPRMPVYDEVREWYLPKLVYAQERYREFDLVLIGAVEGPILDAYSYMDMNLFAEAIFKAPELLAYILDCCTAFSAHIARVYAEVSQTPLLFLGEDIAGRDGPIFNPEFIRSEALPRWKRIAVHSKAKNMKLLFHTDGKYGDFLDLIFNDLGADGLNPIERNGCNDIFQIRTAFPDKLLFGNVCGIHTLPHGTPGDVEDETLELIEKIGPQGGIFIGSSSELHNAVPIANAAVMYRTVREYGVYPIDVERIRERRNRLREEKRLTLRSKGT